MFFKLIFLFVMVNGLNDMLYLLFLTVVSVTTKHVRQRGVPGLFIDILLGLVMMMDRPNPF